MRALVFVVAVAFAALPVVSSAKGGGSRPSYGGGKHTSSHGGHYQSGKGSSHKGGAYRNSRTSDQYGKHKQYKAGLAAAV